MTNLEVIKAFLNGEKAQTNLRDIQNGYFMYKGRTLTTDGEKLINYNTIIAFKTLDKLYINSNKYSRTTSKIQSQLGYTAHDYYNNNQIEYYTNINIVEK